MNSWYPPHDLPEETKNLMFETMRGPTLRAADALLNGIHPLNHPDGSLHYREMARVCTATRLLAAQHRLLHRAYERHIRNDENLFRFYHEAASIFLQRGLMVLTEHSNPKNYPHETTRNVRLEHRFARAHMFETMKAIRALAARFRVEADERVQFDITRLVAIPRKRC